MTSLYNIMTFYTIEQLENQLSKRQPSSLLIITKNFSLFVTNFKKSVQISPHAFRSSSYLFKNYSHIPVTKHINAAQVYKG